MSIKIYRATDVDLDINVIGIDVADITAMTVSLERTDGVTIAFTLAAGDITISGSTVNLRIEDGILTSIGTYQLRITATENGNLRGLTSDPGYILVV